MSKKTSKQYLTLHNEKILNKNKSMNFLFKTMPEKKQSSQAKSRKSTRKKSERSRKQSVQSREMSKNNSFAQNLRTSRKKRSTRKKNEVKDMFELQLKKHLMQADQAEPSKSSYLDFNLEKVDEGGNTRKRFSDEWEQNSSLVPELTTFKEIKFNIEMEEKKMRKNIKRTIDKFIKKKNQMINSLQTVNTKAEKKKSAREHKNNKSTKVSNSGEDSKRKSQEMWTGPAKKPKTKGKKKSRQNTEKTKKNFKKKELNFYESEKKKKKARNFGSTRIKTEEDSGTLRNEESRQLEDFFAPLNIKRTYIDSGRNTGLLCKVCLGVANQNQRENKGVQIPQCDTEKCINSKNQSGKVPLVTQGIDERLDQAFAESLLNMESEIIEKGFGDGFMESSQEPQKVFDFKESSIINEDIQEIGSEKKAKENRFGGAHGPSEFESSLDLFVNESNLQDLGSEESKEKVPQQEVSNSTSLKNEFNQIDSEVYEKNKISIKEHSNFGILLSNEDLIEEENLENLKEKEKMEKKSSENNEKSGNEEKVEIMTQKNEATPKVPKPKQEKRNAKVKISVPKQKKKPEK